MNLNFAAAHRAALQVNGPELAKFGNLEDQRRKAFAAVPFGFALRCNAEFLAGPIVGCTHCRDIDVGIKTETSSGLTRDRRIWGGHRA